MRHQMSGRQLSRNSPHRKAMFRNMANSIIQMEQIQTTLPKAKEIRRIVDRLITMGKSGEASSKKVAFDRTRDQAVVEKLFGELSKRYAKRNGGYTRILRLSETRRGDSSDMAVVELVDHPEIDRKRKSDRQQAAKNKTEAQASTNTDPYAWMRRSFGQGGGKAKVKTSAKAKAKKTAK